jgi:hypothetical protein
MEVSHSRPEGTKAVSRQGQYVSPKHWYPPTSPHGVTTQKVNINIFTTENLRSYVLCIELTQNGVAGFHANGAELISVRYYGEC